MPFGIDGAALQPVLSSMQHVLNGWTMIAPSGGGAGGRGGGTDGGTDGGAEGGVGGVGGGAGGGVHDEVVHAN